jgi:hypothetical protein
MEFRGRGATRTAELNWRKAATDKTLARYKNRQFDWSTGVTCIHMAWAHLRAMGHRPPTLPRFRSALMAKRALNEAGHEGVTALLDSLLPRIAPARMMLGDLATVEGEVGLDAIMICAGPQRLFGWREDEAGLVVLGVAMKDVKAAWSV